MKRKDINVYIRDKKGYYYAVIVYKNALGKRKEKWFPTKLQVRGNKKKAEAMIPVFIERFAYLEENKEENKKDGAVALSPIKKTNRSCPKGIERFAAFEYN